jgi:hypothetical protein
VAAAAASRAKAAENGADHDRMINNQSGAKTSSAGLRIYSPDSGMQSPMNGGYSVGLLPPPKSSSGRKSPPMKSERPSSLGSVIGVNPTIANNNNNNTKGKRTRWLLCYPSGGAASSESPSPPTDEAPGRVGSNVSTPSPTDGGFRIPNSQSNERPTSLPVALLNSSQRNGRQYYFKMANSKNDKID